MNPSQTPAQASASESGSAAPPPPKTQAAVPLTSVEHGYAPSANNPNPNASHDHTSKGTSLSSPSHPSKRGSLSGTPSHRTKSNSASTFTPAMTAGVVDSGVSSTKRRSGQATTPAAAADETGNGALNSTNASLKGNAAATLAPEAVQERKGRRASRRGNANWFESEPTKRPADTELNQNVATVNDGVADQELARREQAERAQRQAEQLAQHISDPPTGFQPTLPRLSELDVTNSWDKLLRMIRNEYDMSCLTNCLARELDEDVAWNPEMLLVQLTSDMMDAAELQKDNEVYVPVDASDIGQMTGGEVVRKRGEKTVPGQGESGPAPGDAAGDTTTATNSNKDSAPSPKASAGFVADDTPAGRSPSKRKSSAASKASSRTANSPAKKEVKPQSNKKSGVKPLPNKAS